MSAVPWMLKRFLLTVPDSVHEELISRLLNHLIKGQPQAKKLSTLEGVSLGLVINDTGSQWQFRVEEGRLCVDHRGYQSWDVCIRGDLQDFLLLALRAEDPDTLFFSRRLSLEGQTEAGLYVKNMLDAFEFDWAAHASAVVGERLSEVVFWGLRQSGLDGALMALGQGVHRSIIGMVTQQD